MHGFSDPSPISTGAFEDVSTCGNQVAGDSTAQLNGSTTVVRQQQRAHGAIAEFFSFNSYTLPSFARTPPPPSHLFAQWIIRCRELSLDSVSTNKLSNNLKPIRFFFQATFEFGAPQQKTKPKPATREQRRERKKEADGKIKRKKIEQIECNWFRRRTAIRNSGLATAQWDTKKATGETRSDPESRATLQKIAPLVGARGSQRDPRGTTGADRERRGPTGSQGRRAHRQGPTVTSQEGPAPCLRPARFYHLPPPDGEIIK